MSEPATHPEDNEDTRIHAASIVLRLRKLGISDRAVLNAIEAVPRKLFVPEEWRRHAYSDRALPIECGQTISAPSIVGMMIAALDLSDRHSVLEIGTGSGYQSAVLARLARRVTTIDRFRTLLRLAEARWQALGIRNITGIVADGMLGWSRQAPFDRIVLAVAVDAPPVKLIMQLSDSGVLVAPIGPENGPQRVTVFQRVGNNVVTRDVGTARFLPAMTGNAQIL